jgi:hypothetical protein
MSSLDALGLGDIGLKSMFGELFPIEEDHLVAIVSSVRNRSQLIASLTLITRLSFPTYQSKGVTNHQVRPA